MIGEMTPGNLVDYIVTYTETQEKIHGVEDKKEVKIREATQADFDNF